MNPVFDSEFPLHAVDDRHHSAAARIQANFKGMLARKKPRKELAIGAKIAAAEAEAAEAWQQVRGGKRYSGSHRV